MSDRREKASRTWHPWRKWSVSEAVEIMNAPTPYAKLMTKALIGFEWREEEERRRTPGGSGK